MPLDINCFGSQGLETKELRVDFYCCFLQPSARATRLTFLAMFFPLNIWTYSLSLLLCCNAIRARIWINIHYTYTHTFIHFKIFFYYKFIHSFFYQSTSTDKTYYWHSRLTRLARRRNGVIEFVSILSKIESYHWDHDYSR